MKAQPLAFDLVTQINTTHYDSQDAVPWELSENYSIFCFCYVFATFCIKAPVTILVGLHALSYSILPSVHKEILTTMVSNKNSVVLCVNHKTFLHELTRRLLFVL